MPAFYTGKNPAKIGLFSHTKADLTIPLSNDIKGRKIWDYLRDAGKKSLLFNLPLTFPPQEVNGIIVSGYPTPSYNENIYTYPPELSKELDFPEDIMILEKNRHRFTITDKKKILDKQIEITIKRFEIASNLIKKEKFDFSIFFVKGTDMLQHLIWDRKDYLLEYYKIVDDIVGRWVELNKNANIFIISDHGFDAYPQYKFHINTWLEHEGYLKYKDTSKDKIVNRAFGIGRKVLPLKAKHLLNQKVLKPKIKGESASIIDIENTVAFRDRYGIRLNKTENAKEIRDEIIKKLSDLEIENERLIREIHERESLYNGKYIEEIPDIVMLLNKKFILSSSFPGNINFFSNVKEKDQFGYGAIRTGVHDSAINGIFFSFGPDIDNSKKVENARLLDIAPTILHMFGISVPEDMDGRVLKEIFNSNIQSDIVFCKKSDEEIVEKKGITKDEEKRIKEKLKLLGYLD